MTKAQRRIINRLKRDILENDGLGKQNMDKSEYKEFKIEERSYRTGPIVFLSTVVGLKEDEGTMAACLCRYRRLFMIGPRGGIKGLLGKKKTGYTKALIYSYTH